MGVDGRLGLEAMGTLHQSRRSVRQSHRLFWAAGLMDNEVWPAACGRCWSAALVPHSRADTPRGMTSSHSQHWPPAAQEAISCV